MQEKETRMYIKRAQEKDRDASEILIKENAGLVHGAVRRFVGRGLEYDDLFQIGSMGMLKAILNFDFTMNVKFSTYAVHMIIGEIRRVLRDNSMIKVSRGIRETAIGLIRIKQELEAKLNREITVQELAEKAEMPACDVVFALDALTPAVSLNEHCGGDESSGGEIGDMITGDSGEGMIEAIALHEVLSRLSERDRTIIEMRYFQGKTQSEIAVLLGTSQVQISRFEKKALAALKVMMLQ